MGRGGFVFSWLDVKLGVRMLLKHPGLTLAAVFALAVGIPVGMAPMHFAGALAAPLPEDPSDRIRVVRYWNVETNQPEMPTYYELAQWTEELTSFESVGAFRREVFGYNVAIGSGSPSALDGAEVTASTFEILGTAPLLGRTLGRADEEIGAADVAVIGYDAWQARFAGDPDIVGRTLRVAGVPHTIIGIMPKGFLFPDNEQLWLPLRDEPSSVPGSGLGLTVLGTLADGSGMDEARSQATTFGRRMAAEFPETHARLEAQVVHYGTAEFSLPQGGLTAFPGFLAFRLLCFALLLVACANVAMLVFARMATRLRELAIRTALGAGRARVVSQMFVEALLLTAAATTVGLPAYVWILGRIQRYITGGDQSAPTYWIDLGISVNAVLSAMAFAVLSAAVVAIVPALKVTGKEVQQTIQRAQAGRSGVRFGGVTGALIVADVAIAVAAVGFGLGVWERVQDSSGGQDLLAMPAEEYLATTLRLRAGETTADGADLGSQQFVARLAEMQRTLVERLEAEPRVRGVAFANDLPRNSHDMRRIEIDDETALADLDFFDAMNRWVSTARVDIDFFDALEQPILAGRGFDQADLDESARPVIVNTRFVDRQLGGRNAIGRRVRFPDAPGDTDAPWYEIVGVVPPLGMNLSMPQYDSGIYFPVAPGEVHPLKFAVHVAGNPETFALHLRAIIAEVDPDAVISPPTVLGQIGDGNAILFVLMAGSLAGLVGILLAMATSGLYAIMSFAVSERTREIGIRTALGARRTLAAFRVARRSLVQIGVGALLGMPLAGWLFQTTETMVGRGDPGVGVAFGVAFATGVAVVGLIGGLSFFSPMRRALRIQPTEALRGET